MLVLTAFSDRPRILGALEAGACGYLLKDVASDEVAEGIRAAARGESPLDPRAARTVLSARAEPDPLAGLSQREREVLDALVEGLPNKLIARRLEISEKTVKSAPDADLPRARASPTAPRPRCGPSATDSDQSPVEAPTRTPSGCEAMRSLSAVLLALFFVGCSADECQTALDLAPVGGRISARFTIDHAEPGPGWTLVVVHEGHVAWRGRRAPRVRSGSTITPAPTMSRSAPTGPNGRICTAEKTISARN